MNLLSVRFNRLHPARSHIGRWMGCLLCLGASALAEPAATGKSDADLLFEQGKQALKQGNLIEACERFNRSQAIDPSPSTLVKIARCHEHDGQLRAALAKYESALALMRSRPKGERHARDLERLVVQASEKLAARLATLHLQVTPRTERAKVTIDGETLPTGSGETKLDAGKHRIEVEALGYRPESVELTLAEAEVRTLEVPLTTEPAVNPALPTATPRLASAQTPAPRRATLPAPAPPSAAAAQVSPSARHPLGLTASHKAGGSASSDVANSGKHGNSQRIVGVVAASVGVVLLGGSAYLGIRTNQLVNESRENGKCNANFDCNADGLALIDRAERTQTQALLLAAGGALLLGTGVVLFATAPSSERATGPSLSRQAVVPRGGGSNLTLRLAPGVATLGGRW